MADKKQLDKEAQVLLEHIRPFDAEKDKNVAEFSHSRLEVFEQCPYKFDLHYNQQKISGDTAIALEFGSLCHYVLEMKGQMILNNQPIDYKKLIDTLDKGTDELPGIVALKFKYMNTWNALDTEGRTYPDKVANVEEVIKTEMENDEWKVFATEHPFEFVYDNRAKFRGSIDRIDYRINEDGETEYRIIDYKTAKKPYEDNKLTTSQQHSIYNMAFLLEYGVLPVANLYRHICIGETQYALTKGWSGRIVKKFDKVFGEIDEDYKQKLWPVKPSPLCHFCQFCITNPEATKYKRECDYYMKWTRSNKDFSVNKPWNPELEQKTKKVFDFNW